MPGPYYSQRQGGVIVRDKENLSEDFWWGYRAIIKEFGDKNYFCQHFYDECTDGHPMSWSDHRVRARLWQELGKVEWPLPENLPPQERAFDYIEFLGDFVSKPTDGWSHSFCGNYHPNAYDAQAGQFEYRERVNGLLRNFRHPYDLDGKGRIRKESSPILDLPVRDAEFEIEDGHLRNLLDAAVSDFYDRSGQKKLQAVRSLVDAFERLKTIEHTDKKRGVEQLIKKLSPMDEVHAILDQDMKDLTDIANQYTIRHHEVTKKALTDEDFLDYLFYQYYNVIRLILKKYGMIRERAGAEAGAGQNASAVS